MRPRPVLTALGAIVALLVGGCTGSTGPDANLPVAADLLTRSAAAMRTVSTAALDIEVDPALVAVPVRAASGSVTAAGEAVGTATLAQGGNPVEFAFVVAGGKIYLRGPTGGFGPPIPVRLASRYYDPTAILDPERGVARLLATATPGATQAREDAEGVDSFRVAATFDPAAVGAVVPGVAGPVQGLLWIDAATSRLVRAELQVPAGPDAATGPVTVRLHDYNAPVTVTPPG